MSHIGLREEVIKLRQQGYTYGQIKRELGVSKSTLSEWLSKTPLNNTQIELLSINKQRAKDVSREKYIETRKKQRLTRLVDTYQQEVKSLVPLTEKELFIAGLFLYWGEGEKSRGRISISNTDPRIVKFSLYWLVHVLNIPKERIKVNLHLYQDMDINDAIDFWSQTLALDKTQFTKPYIKKSNRTGLTYKSFGHGTCRLYAGSVLLSEKIAMAIKAISDKYGAQDEIFWYN